MKPTAVFILSIVIWSTFISCIPQGFCASGGPSYLEGSLIAEKTPGVKPAAAPIKIHEVLGRMVVSLVLVIGLIFLFAFTAKKFISGGPMSKKNSLVQVLDTSYLSPKKMIYVVDIAGEILVLGSDADKISFLSKIEDVQAKKIILSYSAKMNAKGRFSKALDGYLNAAKGQEDGIEESGEKPSKNMIQECIRDVRAQITKIKKISDEV